MPTSTYLERIRVPLGEAGIQVHDVEQREFPGEKWLITFIDSDSLTVAQSMAGSLEDRLNAAEQDSSPTLVVIFRPVASTAEKEDVATKGGRLAGRDVDRLVQLLEARSRTSDALPSLKYMEDPRASLAAVGASRHQLIYGRRGVGKTAILLEAKRVAEQEGHMTAWLNAHVIRHLDVGQASLVAMKLLLDTIADQAGTSSGESFSRIRTLREELQNLEDVNANVRAELKRRLPSINDALRPVLRAGLIRLYFFIDDFYLLPQSVQPAFIDYLAGALRDCDAWIKIASIERLTRPFEPSAHLGLEVPHDAVKIDLDVTLEDPKATQQFLETVLFQYTATAGIKSPASIAKREALGRLVLASGGVPRDYLNLFAASLVGARKSREQASEVGREDVSRAAGVLARGKKRDLEQDTAGNADALLRALEVLSSYVKGEGYTYFRVDIAQKRTPEYELFALLVDLRFAHLVQSSLSDQHKSGVRYEAYVLDLSEYADVRLGRGLHILDLEDGAWTLRLTGQARSKRQLSGTQLRDELRQSPLVDLKDLSPEP